MIYFTASDNNWGGDLWKSDGTEAQTQRVQDGMPNTWVYQPIRSGPQAVSLGSNFYFEGNFYNQNSTELWKSDGTSAGTNNIKSFSGTQVSLEIKPENYFNSRFYFKVLYPSTSIEEIWLSDGTTGGTMNLLDISPLLQLSQITILVHSSNALYFTALSGTTTEVYKTDGLTITKLTGEGCADQLLVNTPVLSSTDYKASESIIGSSLISGTVKAQFLAGKYIELQPGFSTSEGTVFTANIETCND